MWVEPWSIVLCRRGEEKVETKYGGTVLYFSHYLVPFGVPIEAVEATGGVGRAVVGRVLVCLRRGCSLLSRGSAG